MKEKWIKSLNDALMILKNIKTLNSSSTKAACSYDRFSLTKRGKRNKPKNPKTGRSKEQLVEINSQNNTFVTRVTNDQKLCSVSLKVTCSNQVTNADKTRTRVESSPSVRQQHCIMGELDDVMSNQGGDKILS